MGKCEISNKDLLSLLGAVWVQAELGPALGQYAGEAWTTGRVLACPVCPEGFHPVGGEDHIILGGPGLASWDVWM